jgi:two-component system, cell cycle response regulator DivK
MESAHALVIDDNVTNIDVLVMLLAQQGVTTRSVASLPSVRAALEEMPKLDVIFLDLEFPNGSGFDLFRSLKADPLLANVPVVAYSVHISEIERVRREGFQGFLGKPLDARHFPQQLQKILNGIPVWEM